MKRATLVLAGLALLVGGVGQAKADFIYGTAQVSGGLVESPTNGNALFPVSDGPNYGFPASASAANSSGVMTGSGSANVNLVELPGFTDGFTWQLHTQMQLSYNTPPDFFPRPYGGVISTATWQDVLLLSNTDPLLVGHTLRLNFQATGFLSAMNGAEVGNTLAATGTNSPDPSFGQLATQQVHAELHWDQSSPVFSGAWDSMTLLGGGFYRGTFHLDIPIVPGLSYIAGEPGGFYYSLSDSAGSPSGGQLVTAIESAADPAGFLSITLPDVGNVTPESLGVSVTFQSGIVSPNLQPSATAVPEPSSIALLATATLTVLGYFGWRRRGRAAAKKVA
jgi:hypothetical protein